MESSKGGTRPVGGVHCVEQMIFNDWSTDAMTGRFEIDKRSNGEFQFNLKAGNGQIILTSEGYTAKASCSHGIDSVRDNSQHDDRFDRKIASNGKAYFNLTAGNGQVIGSSQMYVDTSGRDKGITSVKTNAPSALVSDHSG